MKQMVFLVNWQMFLLSELIKVFYMWNYGNLPFGIFSCMWKCYPYLTEAFYLSLASNQKWLSTLSSLPLWLLSSPNGSFVMGRYKVTHSLSSVIGKLLIGPCTQNAPATHITLVTKMFMIQVTPLV